MVWVVIKRGNCKSVCYELQKRFEDENFIEYEQAETWLRFNLKEINRELFEYAQTNEEYKGMGTTCVCALVFDKNWNIGILEPI